MSQKNRKAKAGGRPKGHPKTGGRKKGTRNKGNVRLRELFAKEGFDYVSEVMETLDEIKDAGERMDALLKLAPYFMQRLRQEEESAGGALAGLAEDDPDITTADLQKIAEKL